MPDEKHKKGQHLTWQDRHEIQNGLREKRSFREIGDIIGCSPDTVSKEIRNHRYHKERKANDRVIPNRCKFRDTCRRKDVCNKKKGHKCRIPCRECLRCNKLCPDFVDAPCSMENKAPYVCNGCRKSQKCLFEKYVYNADYAHKEYIEKLHNSRKGIDLTRDELAALDELVSPLIRKGQPLVHIVEKHESEIPCSLRTLYSYIDSGYLSARNLDMHRTVRYKKRVHHEEPKTSPRKKAGRHYKDFLKWMQEHPDTRVVEMDTVEGTKGGKMLQTFLWRENNLMLAFLIDGKEMKNTVAIVDWMEEILGSKQFQELFPLILTDNGTEFADPELFENGLNGEKRTKLYYCEPRMSNQKGGLEKNHEYIRYVLPKGTSFNDLDQEKVTCMVNHINNTIRPKHNGRTPMSLALEKFNAEALEQLGLKVIPHDDICLRPELIK